MGGVFFNFCQKKKERKTISYKGKVDRKKKRKKKKKGKGKGKGKGKDKRQKC